MKEHSLSTLNAHEMLAGREITNAEQAAAYIDATISTQQKDLVSGPGKTNTPGVRADCYDHMMRSIDEVSVSNGEASTTVSRYTNIDYEAAYCVKTIGLLGGYSAIMALSADGTPKFSASYYSARSKTVVQVQGDQAEADFLRLTKTFAEKLDAKVIDSKRSRMSRLKGRIGSFFAQ